MSEKTYDQLPVSARNTFDFVGRRNEGISTGFIAAATAVGVGIDAMCRNGPSKGAAIGAAASALGAYIVAEAIDATAAEAAAVGGLAGSLGMLAGSEIDSRFFAPDPEPSALMESEALAKLLGMPYKS